MKFKEEIKEVENEGLIALINLPVLIMCFNYFYTGILRGVNTDCILLEKCDIVYETGEWSAKSFKDSQRVGEKHYIQMSAIESFCQHSKILKP